jgi:hypothetical protein
MNMKLIYILTLSLLLLVSRISAQDTSANETAKQKYTLSGIVSDAKSNETLIGVNVYFPQLKTGTTTNEYGFYSITIPKGNYEVQISYVSFQTFTEKVMLTKNTKKSYKLSSIDEQLDEVVITESRKTNIKRPEMSVNKLSIATIKKMPVVLGGKNGQIDHHFPVQIDHQYRSKLTTTFQSKLTT